MTCSINFHPTINPCTAHFACPETSSPPVPCLIGARRPAIRTCKVVGAPVDRPDLCSGYRIPGRNRRVNLYPINLSGAGSSRPYHHHHHHHGIVSRPECRARDKNLIMSTTSKDTMHSLITDSCYLLVQILPNYWQYIIRIS